MVVSPAVSRTLRYLAGIQDDEPAPTSVTHSASSGHAATQPSFAPEDYSSSVIAPPPPPAPTYTAPFQDDAPPPPPPPVRDDYRRRPQDDVPAAVAVPEPPAPPPAPRPQYTGPSYAQPRRAPGEQSTLERLPEMAQAGIDAASATLGDRGSVLAGLRPPQTAMEVIEQAAPAPVRGLQIGREVLRSAGGAALEAAPQTTEPLFTTNEIQTPLGTIPSMTGPTPQQAGRFAGEELADPTSYLSFGAAGRAADAPIEAAGRAVAGRFRGMQGPLRAGVRGVAGALAENAGQVADEGVQYLGAGLVPAGDESRRFYHGTAEAFARPDPAKFAVDGLYGPGYYLTDNPTVASSYASMRNTTPGGLTPKADLRAMRLNDEIRSTEYQLSRTPSAEDRAWLEGRLSDARAELERVTRQGPNVRAVDVPEGLNLLDADAPAPERLVYPANQLRAADGLPPVEPGLTGAQFYDAVRETYPTGSKRAVNEFLMRRGIDGIRHTGGQIMGLVDEAGRPIEHQVTVVFPDALDKIRNAFSGEAGGSGVITSARRGLRAPLYNFAQGGVLGAASESLQAQEEGRDVDPAEMGRRALIGGGLGVLAGSRAARNAVRSGVRLGAGVVPGPARLPIDPAQVAAEAQAGPRRGALLNQKLDPPGSQVPRGVRTATALTDDLAATRWAEDLLTQASGRGRLAEDAPERASTLKRINADSVSEERIARELAPVVASARQEGLLDELVQYVQDTHESDVLAAFYRRSYDEALAAGATPAAADAAGMARMQRRSSANPDLTWEAVGARLQGQQQRVGAQAKRLDELATGLWDHNRDTLDHLRASGRISQDQYDWLTQTYPHYVPTVPISHLDPGGGTAAVGRGGGAGVSAGRRTAGDVSAFEDVASPAERLNPIIATREATIARERAAHRNDVFQAFARLYDAAQQAAPGTLQTSQGARKNRFLGEVEASGRVDGQPVTIRVPKPVADMIDTTAAQGGSGAGPMALWRKAMSAVTTSTTGRRAAFLPVNLARDFNDSLLRAGSAYGVTAIPEYLGLWMQEAGNAAVDLATGLVRGTMQPTGRSTAYLARGGGMGSVEGGWKAAEQWYDDVQRTGGMVITDPRKLGAIMRDLATFKPVMAANERTELISRTAMMRMAERRGASPTEAMIAGRNASVDFQRAGQITRMFNGAIPFLNATVQSGAQLKRTLLQHPRSAAATFATVVGVPVAAAEAYNRSDPNRAAAYNDVPQYVKDQGIVLMLPWSSSDARGDRPNYLWLPLGMGASVAIAVREAMRDVPGLAPSAGRADVPSDASEASRWETVLSQILSVFSPIKGDSAAAIASSMVPPGAKQAVELGLNRSLYTGAPIASDTADERASSFGHAVAGAAGSLGRAVGSDLLQEVRPSHVDYAARQLPAYGDVLTGVSDMVAPSAAKQEERRPIANAPLVGGAAARIVRDVGGANLERAQSDMLSPTVRDALAEAGMRASDVVPVQGSISVQGQQMPLLRDEQVDFQERTTSYADREIDAAQRSADWRAEGADRESLVRAALTKARQKAADEVVRGIPPAERRQRIREAAERKAS